MRGQGITMGEAAAYSLFGMVMVFLVLVLLMAMVCAIGRLMKEKAAERRRKSPAAEREVGRYDVPDKTVALLMAIVAEEMGAPPETLRFVRIWEAEKTEEEKR